MVHSRIFNHSCRIEAREPRPNTAEMLWSDSNPNPMNLQRWTDPKHRMNIGILQCYKLWCLESPFLVPLDQNVPKPPNCPPYIPRNHSHNKCDTLGGLGGIPFFIGLWAPKIHRSFEKSGALNMDPKLSGSHSKDTHRKGPPIYGNNHEILMIISTQNLPYINLKPLQRSPKIPVKASPICRNSCLD